MRSTISWMSAYHASGTRRDTARAPGPWRRHCLSATPASRRTTARVAPSASLCRGDSTATGTASSSTGGRPGSRREARSQRGGRRPRGRSDSSPLARGPRPEHRDTLAAWLTVCDQWRVLGWPGQVLGLDWPAVKTLLDAADIALDAARLAGLRVMERDVVRVWRERRDQAVLTNYRTIIQVAARWRNARKVRASLSYRVTMRRNCLSLLNHRSTCSRSWYFSAS